MAECELINGCIFFNDKMLNMPATAELLQKEVLQGRLCHLRPVHGLQGHGQQLPSRRISSRSRRTRSRRSSRLASPFPFFPSMVE